MSLRERKSKKWRQKEERNGRKGIKREDWEKYRVSKRDCKKSILALEQTRPIKQTVETLTPPLSRFSPRHHSFFPPICSAAAPGLSTFSHPISSLSLFLSLIIIPLFFYLHAPPSPFLFVVSFHLNSSFSSVCLPQSVSFISLNFSSSPLWNAHFHLSVWRGGGLPNVSWPGSSGSWPKRVSAAKKKQKKEMRSGQTRRPPYGS